MMGEPHPVVGPVCTPSIYASNPSALESFDSFEFLQDYRTSIEDVSQEILYSISEIREKDIEYHELRDKIVQEHETLRNHQLLHGSTNSHPQEDTILSEIKTEYEKLDKIQSDKIVLSKKLDTHIKRLDHDLLEKGVNPLAFPSSDLAQLTELDEDEEIKAALLESLPRIETPVPFRPARKRRKTSEISSIHPDSLLEVRGEEDTVYCICRQVSFGEMIGCDNINCPVEWFHYSCVGLKEPPKGSWFCPNCAVRVKKKNT